MSRMMSIRYPLLMLGLIAQALIGNAEAPRPRAVPRETPKCYAVAKAGSYAYLGWGGQVLCLDVRDPSEPRLAGSFELPPIAYGNHPLSSEYIVSIKANGSYLYVAAAHGLFVLSIQNPAHPELSGVLSVKDNPPYSYGYGLCVASPFGSSFGGGDLYLYHLADATRPTQSPTYHEKGMDSLASVIDGSTAFIATLAEAERKGADPRGGLSVMDISTPERPRVLASCFDPRLRKASALAKSGALVLIGTENGLLQIVDVSDPREPVFKGECPMLRPNRIYAIGVRDRQAVLVNGFGLIVCDFSDPSRPVLRGQEDAPGRVVDLALSGKFAYVAMPDMGLQVYSLKNPSRPMLWGAFRPQQFQLRP